MAETPVDDRAGTVEVQKPHQRRGFLALAWAAVAGIALKVTTRPVSAGVDGDVVLGALNVSASQTHVRNTGQGAGLIANSGTQTSPGASTGFLGSNSNANGYGVWGYAAGTASTGVNGFGTQNGIWGTSGAGSGVRGVSSTGVGVLGECADGIPLRGEATGSSANTVAAIYGLNYSTYAGPGPGAGGFGIYGLSAKGHGLVGATAAAGAAAVVGATNGVAGAYAAAFYGPVIVGGDFTVVGGAKSAAVPHPDGSHRLLYCVESPESWFEDFGKARLDCGRATVTIDPDFAAVADLADYHVFLTEQGSHQHLVVSEHGPASFVVEADKDLAALKKIPVDDLNGTFSWRLIAKRKDIRAERLAPIVTPPAPILPTPEPTPAQPTPTVVQRSAR